MILTLLFSISNFQLSTTIVQADPGSIVGRAVVVVGSYENGFYLGGKAAYDALTELGYNPVYLDVVDRRSSHPDQPNYIVATKYNVMNKINWLIGSSDGNDIAVLCLVDHGFDDPLPAYFNVNNGTEKITYVELGSSIGEKKIGRLIIDVDACRSGYCFQASANIVGEDRIVMSSCMDDEFCGQGDFSKWFWPFTVDYNITHAFNNASWTLWDLLPNADWHPLLDDSGDNGHSWTESSPLPKTHDGYLSNVTYLNCSRMANLAVNTKGEDASGNHTLTGVDVCINGEIHRSSKVEIILAKDCLYTIKAQVNVSQGEYDKWTFDRWEDDSRQNPREGFPLTNDDESITAIYKRAGQTYNLTIGESSNGATNQTAGIYEYNAGTPVVVRADPDPLYSFDYWVLDGGTEYNNPITVTMNSNHSLTAYFASWPTLTIQTTSGGSTSPLPGEHRYPLRDPVSVEAIPGSDCVFDYWTLDGGTEYDNPITVTMDSNHTLTATFSWPTLTIQTTSGGSTDPAPGEHHYVKGSYVDVEADPDPDYSFNYWKLDGSYKSSNPITVTMDSDHTLKAYFSLTGCPYVYTWNGSAFAIDNNVLADSEVSGGADVEDFYMLEQNSVPTYQGSWFSWYSMQIREFENEHSYLDKVRLYAVDHDPDVNVAITPMGEILTYSDPDTPISAVDDFGNDWLSSLLEIDDSYYRGFPTNYLMLDFGNLDVSQAAKLVLRANMEFKKTECIHVQTLDQDGDWTDVSILRTRNNWSTIIVSLDGYLPNPDGTLKVRLYFNGIHRIDYVGLDTTPQAVITERVAIALRAIHSIQGRMTFELLFDDGEYSELLPNEQIEFGFVLPNTEKERTLILYVEGHYETIYG